MVDLYFSLSYGRGGGGAINPGSSPGLACENSCPPPPARVVFRVKDVCDSPVKAFMTTNDNLFKIVKFTLVSSVWNFLR